MNPYILAGLGYLIVFLVLVMLYLVFNNLPRMLGSVTRVQAKAKEMTEAVKEAAAQRQAGNNEAESKPRKDDVLTGEINAAIATALHLYLNEQHDDEDLRLTIQSISRKYSPWSSKIYGVMNQPNRG